MLQPEFDHAGAVGQGDQSLYRRAGNLQFVRNLILSAAFLVGQPSCSGGEIQPTV
jgi:hypothetical protein